MMGDDLGRAAASPAELPGRGWWNVLKRTYRQSNEDHLGLIAAGVAFYGFLALVPLLGAMVLAYGLFVDPAEVARHMHALGAMLPADAAKLIDKQLADIVATASSKKGFGLLLALLLSIYGAMKGAGAVVTALNVAYEEEEKRGFFRTTLLNGAITVGAVAVAAAALLAASATGFAQDLAARMSPFVAAAIKYLSWIVAAALASGAVATLYRYAPSREHAQCKWLTPGSVVATLGWAAMTIGFGFYAAHSATTMRPTARSARWSCCSCGCICRHTSCCSVPNSTPNSSIRPRGIRPRGSPSRLATAARRSPTKWLRRIAGAPTWPCDPVVTPQ